MIFEDFEKTVSRLDLLSERYGVVYADLKDAREKLKTAQTDVEKNQYNSIIMECYQDIAVINVDMMQSDINYNYAKKQYDTLTTSEEYTDLVYFLDEANKVLDDRTYIYENGYSKQLPEMER